MKAEDFDRLKNKVLTIVTESGEMKDFDADKWLIGWLSKPIGSLGGKRPIDFMETDEGVEVISNLLGQIQYGIYG